MAPAAGSRNVLPPPKDGIYRPSPGLKKQARFAPPRRQGHGYAKPKVWEGSTVLKQQTLTQINFVPGGSENPVVLSDSDDDIAASEAPNEGHKRPTNKDVTEAVMAQDQSRNDDTENDEPRSSAQRRTRKRRSASLDELDRCVQKKGDNREKSKKGIESPTRRVKIASGQTPSSSLHTQTLTQIYARVADGHLLDELGGDSLQHEGARDGAEEGAAAEREGSVIPQTPPRYVGAFTDMIGHVSSHAVDRGAMKPQQRSKSATANGGEAGRDEALDDAKAKRNVRYAKDLVIADSFGMDSLGSDVPENHISQTVAQLIDDREPTCVDTTTTPELASSRRLDLSGSDTRRRVGFADGNLIRSSRQGRCASMLMEIPDSEEEVDEDDGYRVSVEDDFEAVFVAGEETQHVLEELALKDHQLSFVRPASSNPRTPTPERQAAASLTPVISQARPLIQTRGSISRRDLATPLDLEKTSTRRPVDQRRVRRRPIVSRPHDPSQFAESQRVPAHILRSLPDATPRSDILLPIEHSAVEAILGGYDLELLKPFSIPRQVVRFWLLDGSLLRYMACVQPGVAASLPPPPISVSVSFISSTSASSFGSSTDWTYAVDQMYELNNPVEEETMREEGWWNGQIRRYTYLAPAIVGQLLWNLRHAIFNEYGNGTSDPCQATPDGTSSPVTNPVNNQTPVRNEDPITPLDRSQHSHTQTQDTHHVSLQIPNTAAHATEDRSPQEPLPAASPQASTPRRQSPTTLPDLPPPTIDPSSASLPEPQTQPRSSQHIPPSSIPSSLVFQDLGDASVTAPQGLHLNLSQLLTKSQMLPDTLVRDVPGLPYEIWDSEDDLEL